MISVIIPVYNVGEYLERCLDSILCQSCKELEIILVDDGSTDQSGALCDNYAAKDERLKVIHQPNGGVSKARNAGLLAASGDYIGFVDADDYLEPNTYECLLKQMGKADADIAICGAWFHWPDKTTQNDIAGLEEKYTGPEETLRNYLGKNYYGRGLWNKLFRREAVNQTLFDEDVSYFEDSLFFCGVLKRMIESQKGIISFVKEPLYHYMIGRDGSSIRNFERYQTSMLSAERICSLFDKNDPAEKPLYDIARFRLAFMAVNCCRQALLNGRKSEAEVYRQTAAKIMKEQAHNKDIPESEKLKVKLGLISPVHGVNIWKKIR